MREMRAIAFVTRLIDEGSVSDRSLKRMNIHAISADSVMRKLSVMSKLNADWEFLTHLRDDGREFAGSWLDQNFDRIGLEFDDRRPRALFVIGVYYDALASNATLTTKCRQSKARRVSPGP